MPGTSGNPVLSNTTFDGLTASADPMTLAGTTIGHPVAMIHQGGVWGIAQRSPKYMEWYSGFALVVTLVWLYLEILRLLSKRR